MKRPAGRPDHHRDVRHIARAAHYFSDCGMGNFWSTHRERDVAAHFQRIQDDGFTHIILIVPWGQFQPKVEDSSLDDRYVKRLTYLIDIAHEYRLKTILRLGYLWEFTPIRISTYERYFQFSFNEKIRLAWERYLKDIFGIVSVRPGFDFAFVSWEDWYWPIFRRLCNGKDSDRQSWAKQTGFAQFMSSRWSLSQLRAVYGVELDDWDDLHVPRHGEPLVLEFANFYEIAFAERIFNAAAAAFPGVGFEARVDADMARMPRGTSRFNWKKSLPSSGRMVAYYHPNVGITKRQDISSHRALQQLRAIALSYSLVPGVKEKVFIDQFNFVTNNPEFPNFARIADTDLISFLSSAGDIIGAHTSGYGVWGYRDWPNDKIYNGAFEFGLDGWESVGSVLLSDGGIGPLCTESRAEVRQKLFQGTPGRAILLCDAAVEGSAAFAVISDSGETFRFELQGSGSHEVSLPFHVTKEFRFIAESGRAKIFRLGICSHIYSSGLYQRDFSERPAVRAIRDINKRFDESKG